MKTPAELKQWRLKKEELDKALEAKSAEVENIWYRWMMDRRMPTDIVICPDGVPRKNPVPKILRVNCDAK